MSNLEAFGFNLPALGHVCQTGVAASCGVTRSPGSKYDQLMIQGDQVGLLLRYEYQVISNSFWYKEFNKTNCCYSTEICKRIYQEIVGKTYVHLP